MRRYRLQKYTTNIFIIFFLFYVGLLVFDISAYFLFVKKEYPFEVGFFKNDHTKRYALTPNFQGSLNYRVGKTPVVINSRGYRRPEWKLDKNFRFMVVGDALTFGLPLSYEDGIVHKTQERVGEFAEIINLGVPGYGTPHILEVIKENCKIISPAHIFYMYFSNDTKFSNINKNYFTIFDGYLTRSIKRDGTPLSNDEMHNKVHRKQSWKFFELVRLINIRTFLSERGMHPRQLIERYLGLDTDRYLLTNNSNFSMENTLRGWRDILEMATVSERCGAVFTMVILTSYAEAYYGIIEPATERLLKKLGNSVEIIDIRKFTRKGVNLTQWYDGHYGPAGTDLVSNVLSGYILGRYPALRKTER